MLLVFVNRATGSLGKGSTAKSHGEPKTNISNKIVRGRENTTRKQPDAHTFTGKRLLLGVSPPALHLA